MNMKNMYYYIMLSMVILSFYACGSDSDSNLPQDTYTGNDTSQCQDKDGDGYGYNCAKGPDCDDNNSKIHENCLQCQDKDGDGYGLGKDCLGADCNDNDVNVHPNGIEICGNGKDDDCKDGDAKCSQECIDLDKDGYGTGKDCKGIDCNDSDPTVNPGVQEICGNQKDDDCKGDGDLKCPQNCMDNDKDYYGTGTDCLGLDCNDNDPQINPKAIEICDGKDNDCDNYTDECSDSSKECDMNTKSCKAKLSGYCMSTADCLTGLVCYGMKCLKSVGANCIENKECQTNLCDPYSKVCVGDICQILKCEDKGQTCDSKKGKCIECSKGEDCQNWPYNACAGGKCISVYYITIYNETKFKDMAQGMVNCYKKCEPTKQVCFCYFIDTYEYLTATIGKDEVRTWICNSAAASDFEGGEWDLSIAQDIEGCGIWDVQELEWKTGITPGSYDLVDCIFWNPNKVWIDKCENYPGE